VGVLAKDDSLFAGMISNLTVYVPFTVESRMSGQPYVSTVYASAADKNNTDAAEEAVTKYLLKRFDQDEDASASGTCRPSRTRSAPSPAR
jgi:hypothetical protein